jgi:hypothetical protein
MSGLVDFFYEQLLRTFPHAFRVQFGAEMQTVFNDMLANARGQGAIAVMRFLGRELLHAPGVVLRAHHLALLRRARQTGRSPWELLLLPPIDPRTAHRDGRHARLQAVLEMLPFLFVAALILTLTYADFMKMPPGDPIWLGIPRFAALFVALPASLLGLARGLPRWTYPWLGYLAGYSALVAYDQNLVWFLVITLITCLLLAFAAAVAHGRNRSLPLRLQGMARSLRLDWTRFSFAVHGALPFLILVAFDDGYRNDQTLWLALSILVLLLGALLYTRSRRGTVQTATLLLALTTSFFCALLKQAYFRGGLLAGLSTSASWMGNVGWLMQLWGMLAVLVMAPQYAGPKLERLVRSLARR